jgi:hypothetical protein
LQQLFRKAKIANANAGRRQKTPGKKAAFSAGISAEKTPGIRRVSGDA